MGPGIRRANEICAARPQAQSGFTLIELLVGLFLFGVMAAAGTVLLSSAVQAGDSSRTLLNDAQSQIRMRALLTADTSQAAPRPWRDGEGRNRAAFSANDGALFTLIRRGWRNPDGAARASLQRVTWTIENGDLIRRAAPMLDGDAPGTETILASGITSARLRFAGSGGWQENWVGTTPAALPHAIELTLAGEDIGQIRHILLVGPGGTA
ncbi:type II secretion system minor pseudopilin GspJ [Sandarakinorhabdus sp.]|uniref:type II secretion system minor pseudopilin GspJ n=1 Tax=Sandarakinorhabdus sp. TaxID=1916663 RepID=UPI003F700966